MATFASRIPFNAQACNEILNQGACIFVKILDNCESEPNLDVITVETAIAISDETASLSSDQTNGTFLRAGTVLNFDTGSIVVLNDTLVANVATAVEIEPAAAGS